VIGGGQDHTKLDGLSKGSDRVWFNPYQGNYHADQEPLSNNAELSRQFYNPGYRSDSAVFSGEQKSVMLEKQNPPTVPLVSNDPRAQNPSSVIKSLTKPQRRIYFGQTENQQHNEQLESNKNGNTHALTDSVGPNRSNVVTRTTNDQSSGQIENYLAKNTFVVQNKIKDIEGELKEFIDKPESKAHPRRHAEQLNSWKSLKRFKRNVYR